MESWDWICIFLFVCFWTWILNGSSMLPLYCLHYWGPFSLWALWNSVLSAAQVRKVALRTKVGACNVLIEEWVYRRSCYVVYQKYQPTVEVVTHKMKTSVPKLYFFLSSCNLWWFRIIKEKFRLFLQYTFSNSTKGCLLVLNGLGHSEAIGWFSQFLAP